VNVLSDTQIKALVLLLRAEHEDVAVRIGRRTEWGIDGPTMTRVTAARLAYQGLARFSRPGARFVLITDFGRTLPVMRRQFALT
jgi:hypothetical protein